MDVRERGGPRYLILLGRILHIQIVYIYIYILPNNLMDEGRFHKILVEEMGTERRMNGGGSRWLLGCWNEAHPRTLAWTTILQCRAVLAMNQTGAG